MDIDFATTSLKKQLNEEKEMVKKHGALRAKKLKIVVSFLFSLDCINSVLRDYP